MSIQPLPASSIRALGSTQAITSPISVLKELVENSIDAGATSISISITPDLLSYIVVKDNGSGIAAADRDAMARPHCTSKLEKFEDLGRVKTLGFRGEALASMAQVSGGMSILTKVEGEVLGVRSEIGRDGAIKSQKNAPCSRGTVVTISKLFDHVPVRQATIEKSASKLITQVWPLLVSYYLTHPGIRFSFQVIPPPEGNKGKKQIEVKYNVVFAATKTVENAIRSSLGGEVVSACFWKELPTLTEEKVSQQFEGYKFEAFLLKPCSDLPLSIRKGAFISLCQRPLSILRPQCIAKKIYSRYKSYLKHVCASQSSITDPFLYLNIVTTSGKVDVNIEPAKDDVLFEDESLVMQMVEQFFEDVYGRLDTIVVGTTDGITPGDQLRPTDHDFNVLLRGRERTLPTDTGAIPSSSFEIPSNQEEFAQLNSVTLKSDYIPFVGEVRPQSTSNIAQTFAQDHMQETNSLLCHVEEQQQSLIDKNNNNSTEVADHGISPASSQQDTSEWAFNMYDTGMTEEEMEDLAVRNIYLPQNTAQHVREPECENDISTSNPWTFARLNSTVSSTKRPAASNNQAVRLTGTTGAPHVNGNLIPSSPSTIGTSITNASNTWSSPNRQNTNRAGYASSSTEALNSSSPIRQRDNLNRIAPVDQCLNERQREEYDEEERIAPIFSSPSQRNNQKKDLWFPKFGGQIARGVDNKKGNNSKAINTPSTPTKNNSASPSTVPRSPWSPAGSNMQSERISNIFPSHKPNTSKHPQKKDQTSPSNSSSAVATKKQNGVLQFFKPVPASHLLQAPHQGIPNTADDFLDDSDEETPQHQHRGFAAPENASTLEYSRQIRPQQTNCAPIIPQFPPVEYKPLFPPQQQQPQDQLQGILCKLNASVTASWISTLTYLRLTPNFEPAELLLPSNSDGYTAHMLDELAGLSVSLHNWLGGVIAKLDSQSYRLNTEEIKLLQHLKNILPPREERDLQLEILPSSTMAIVNEDIEKVVQVRII